MIRYATTDIVNFQKDKAFKMLLLLSLSALIIFVIIAFCRKYGKYRGDMLAAKVESDIKTGIFMHFQKQDFEFFEDRKVGKLVSHITIDAYNLTTLIKQVPETILDLAIRLTCVGIILFLASPLFGAIVFGILILLFSIATYFIPKIQENIKESRKVYSYLTSDLDENLSGIRTVKSFANEEKEISKFKDNVKTYLKTKKISLNLSSTAESIIDPLLIGLIPIVNAY